MTTLLKNSLAIVLLCLLAASAAYGQSVAPELNITLGEQRVKFAPTRSFQEMRLEVVNGQGETVFSHLTADPSFEWNLRAGNGETLAPGLYRYALTLKFGEEQRRQHTGHFIVEKSQDQIWLTANEGTEVSGTALNATRSGGRSVAGLGKTDEASAKRDVSGRGIVDEKGNSLTDDQSEKKSAKQGKEEVSATANQLAKYAPDGVTLIDSAVTETSGNVGIGTTVPNTRLSVSANTAAPPGAPGVIGYFANANNNNTFITADAYGGDNLLNLHSDFLFRRARGTMAAPTAVQSDDIVGQIQMRGYGATGFATTSRAGIRMTAAENWTDAAQGAYLAFLTTPNGSNTINVERMRLTDSGNLGLGTTTPTHKLAVIHGGSTGILSKSTTGFSTIDIDAFNGDAAVRFANNGVNQWNLRNRTDNSFEIFELGGGGSRLTIQDGTGNLGIGVTAPAAKLEVNGDIRSSALRQELTAVSPNVINGFIGTGSGGATPGNRVTAGVVGASIGGGGFNGSLPFPTFGTIMGDNTNRVTDWFGTVGGGINNRAGDDTESLDNAAFATVGGGFNNAANNSAATVGGGSFNTASGDSATVGGGGDNTASGQVSVVPGGFRAVASHYGEKAFASGMFTANGDAQTSTYVLRNTSSGSATAELFLDGASQRLTIAENRALTFDILVVGLGETSGLAGSYHIQGFIMNLPTSSPSITAPVKTVLFENAANHDANVEADATNNSLKITARGFSGGGTYRWVATVRTVEVSIP